MTDALATADRLESRSEAVPDGGGPSAHAGLWRAEFDRLCARGRAFLGTDLAIMGGAMTWVSERHLVAAISNAGGFGVIASGSMMPGMLAEEIAATAALTTKPFGVNVQTIATQKGTVSLDEGDFAVEMRLLLGVEL